MTYGLKSTSFARMKLFIKLLLNKCLSHQKNNDDFYG
jgi:hypothetical protein